MTCSVSDAAAAGPADQASAAAHSQRPTAAASFLRRPGAVTGSVGITTRLRDNQGRGWLRNLRTWWRIGGEQLALPVDGVSGATRPAGTHALHFAGAKGALAQMPAGRYQLAVEVAREQGERELLRVPFEWGGAPNSAQAEGSKELGQVKVDVAD